MHSKDQLNGGETGKSRERDIDEEDEEGEDEEEEAEDEDEGTEQEEEEEEGAAMSQAQASKSGDQVGSRKIDTEAMYSSNRSQKGGKAKETVPEF